MKRREIWARLLRLFGFGSPDSVTTIVGTETVNVRELILLLKGNAAQVWGVVQWPLASSASLRYEDGVMTEVRDG